MAFFTKLSTRLGPFTPTLKRSTGLSILAKLADTPTVFDVIVLPNLYGDILSMLPPKSAGSVGLAGSANIGVYGAMFEAIHGSAPRRGGQNVANPSGLLIAAIQMLVHLGNQRWPPTSITPG